MSARLLTVARSRKQSVLTRNESSVAPPRSIFRFRLWHTFVIIAVAAWGIQSFPICGSTPAVVRIETMKVSYDEIWKKHWAILECKFIKPAFDPGSPVKETFCCCFAVGESFDFGNDYVVGDTLSFRYQRYDFGPLKENDPRVRVLDKFFGLRVLPREYAGSLFVLVSEIDADEDAADHAASGARPTAPGNPDTERASQGSNSL